MSEFPSFNLDDFPEGIGDERGFYSARDSAAPTPYIWYHDIEVEHGRTYTLRVYVHNSAGDTDEDVAKGTRISVNLPTCTGRRIASGAFISSTNTEPKQVYGGVNFTADEPFNLNYIEGSAILCNNYFSCNPSKGYGAPISEDFLTRHGALIGYNALDGSIRGGYQYASYFTFQVRPQFAD